MKIITAVFLAIFASSCYNIERNCTDFKTGEFEFNYTINGEEIQGRFIRNDSLQIEYYNGKIDSSTVRWVNECEFIANTIHPKSISEKKPVHIKVLTTSKESYIFEYSLVGDKRNKQRGIAKKIN